MTTTEAVRLIQDTVTAHPELQGTLQLVATGATA